MQRADALVRIVWPAHAGSEDVSCIRCHGSVGHLELAATNLPAEPEVNRE